MNAVKFLGVGAMVVAIAALSMFIASRLSDEAIMTIVGVFCGIAASIPVSIGLLMALTREQSAYTAGECGETEPVPSSRALAISDRRVREWIVQTGTVPENTATSVWRKDVNGKECVFWRNSESPDQIHYAPLRQIAAGQRYNA